MDLTNIQNKKFLILKKQRVPRPPAKSEAQKQANRPQRNPGILKIPLKKTAKSGIAKKKTAENDIFESAIDSQQSSEGPAQLLHGQFSKWE